MKGYNGEVRVVTLPNERVIKKKKRHFARWLFLVTFAGALTILYLRPLPPATIAISLPTEIAGISPTVTPPEGYYALSAEGFDFLYGQRVDDTVSTASIAKVITVLCILEKKPLRAGEAGPSIVISSDDARRYTEEIARDGTAFAVSEGETYSEYEMLEAILLPSANNIADSMAVWAFGNMENYRSYAQNYVRQQGMLSTVIGPDASGYDPATTSTPKDLVKLAEAALKNPVLMEIAGKREALIKGTTLIKNHNAIVGQNGVTGLKTGRNDVNSGTLLFTAKIGEGTETVNVAGVVANAGTLTGALSDSSILLESLQDDFPLTTILHKNAEAGMLRTAWGSTAKVVASDELSIRRWAGSKIYTYSVLKKSDGTHEENVGTVYAKSDGRKASVRLKLSTPLTGPSILWRLTHIR